MLVLTRIINQGVEIRTQDGKKIRVTIIDVEHGRVRLGFAAPRDVVIHRDEVWDEIDAGRERPPSE